MAGDFSRNSTNRPAGYAGVLMQQGRVQLDADWNEQLALAQHRTQIETRDVIGCCGTPKGEGGFKIEATPDGTDFFIHPGRFYAGGLLCENYSEWVGLGFRNEVLSHGKFGTRVWIKSPRTPVLPSSWLDGRPLKAGEWIEVRAAGETETLRARIVSLGDDDSVIVSPSLTAYEDKGPVSIRRAITYLTQPFYPAPSTDPAEASPVESPASEGLELPDGNYLVYLEAWQREVNALEDSHLREVALGGPDTAVRLQTVWQVKLLKVSERLSLPPVGQHRPCQETLPEWTQLLAAARTTGQMNARSAPPEPDSNPCLLPPSAGFQGLANQLYRVEIFTSSDTLSGATFVWSRDNAMVETGIVNVDSANTNVITVQDLGTDDLHSFSVNDWVEVVDRNSELNGSARFLAQIVAPAPDRSTKKITLSLPVPNPGAMNTPGTDAFRLRRWDMSDASVTPEGVPLKSGWLTLESGVEVSFTVGSYVSRSFWLVPARTATADVEWPPFQVPNTQPVPQPPLGEFHRFCRLAIIESVYGKWTTGDCRLQFPSLTNICADDVCYHSGCDTLKDTETVQQALDHLCEDTSLRFHKQYLHGWGIVCDLQVKCAGDELGSSVIVNKGYAIDCGGNDILLHQPVTFDVLSNIRTPSGIADGAYSLFFDPLDKNQLRVEPYTPPANPVAAALKGTFWADYYEQCLQPLIDVWTGLQSTPANSIVKDSQRVVSSLTNLVAQLATTSAKHSVYISQVEHDWLVKFYELLRAALRDNTFCGLWNDARSLPKYPADDIGGIGTGFGEGFKTRLRMNEAGELAASAGMDNTIHVYEIHNRLPVLTQVLTFPGDSTWLVQDVALSVEGDTLYAIATSGANSSFATTRLNNISWSAGVFPNLALASLVVQSGIPYATAVGKGLFSFQVNSGAVTEKVVFQLNAIGQVAAADSTHLFLTANSDSAVTNAFNKVIYLTQLAGGFVQSGNIALPAQTLGSATDELQILAAIQNQVFSWRAYITANPVAAGSNKLVLVNYGSGDGGGPWAQVDTSENSTTRLAFHEKLQKMLVSFESTNRIALLTETAGPAGGVASHSLALSDAFPAEARPASFIVNNRAEALFALNSVSNTITVFPYNVETWSPARFAALREYASEMLKAYLDLLARLLQYLKDAFCDLLLLQCRVCDAEVEQPVYLAGITVKNSRVYKVCNLSQRRYVKTFPGVEYWLSIIPVIPIVESAIQELCCLSFTGLFSTVKGFNDSPTNMTNIPTASVAYNAMSGMKNLTFSGLTNGLQNKIAPATGITSDYLRNLIGGVGAAPAQSVPANAITGQPLVQAQQSLGQQGVLVDVKSYDPSDIRTNFVLAASAPSQIPAGAAVTLFTDPAGTVKGFEVASSQVQTLAAQVKSVQQAQAAAQPVLIAAPTIEADVATLKLQLANLQASHEQELASRGTQIGQLMASTQILQSSLTDVRAQLTKIAPPKG
jgi:hypothetical protein